MKIMPKHAGTAAPAVARPREMTTNQPSRCYRDGNTLFDGQLPDSAATYRLPSTYYCAGTARMARCRRGPEPSCQWANTFFIPAYQCGCESASGSRFFPVVPFGDCLLMAKCSAGRGRPTWPEIQFAYPRDFGFIEGHSS